MLKLITQLPSNKLFTAITILLAALTSGKKVLVVRGPYPDRYYIVNTGYEKVSYPELSSSRELDEDSLVPKLGGTFEGPATEIERIAELVENGSLGNTVRPLKVKMIMGGGIEKSVRKIVRHGTYAGHGKLGVVYEVNLSDDTTLYVWGGVTGEAINPYWYTGIAA